MSTMGRFVPRILGNEASLDDEEFNGVKAQMARATSAVPCTVAIFGQPAWPGPSFHCVCCPNAAVRSGHFSVMETEQSV